MKNLKTKILLTAISSLVFLSVIAQDTTTAMPVGTDTVTGWKKYLFVALGLYEAAARLVPTLRNCSIISGIANVINFIVPNRGRLGKFGS